MYIASRMNFLHSQASAALEPATPGHHRCAVSEIWDTLARLPSLSLISQLISLANTALGWATHEAQDQPGPSGAIRR